jgi:hypothetical protein
MRGLIGDLRIKTCLVNQNPAETCQVFGKNFSGQLYVRERHRHLRYMSVQASNLRYNMEDYSPTTHLRQKRSVGKRNDAKYL